MKTLDRYLQTARFAKAKPFMRRDDVVLDVGCDDGAMFRELSGLIKYGIGVDPILECKQENETYTLYPGTFPEALPEETKCDVITMLAVLEHVPTCEQKNLVDSCYDMLNPGGRVVITVPSPRVDEMLHVLQALRVVDGMSVHEHYGYKVDETEHLFATPRFRLLKKKKFQFGLNNLFAFERI